MPVAVLVLDDRIFDAPVFHGLRLSWGARKASRRSPAPPRGAFVGRGGGNVACGLARASGAHGATSTIECQPACASPCARSATMPRSLSVFRLRNASIRRGPWAARDISTRAGVLISLVFLT